MNCLSLQVVDYQALRLVSNPNFHDLINPFWVVFLCVTVEASDFRRIEQGAFENRNPLATLEDFQVELLFHWGKYSMAAEN